MSNRTIDETGKDVPQQRGRAVGEVLFLRPDRVMGRVAEWVLRGSAVRGDWERTFHARTRIILDNET